MISGIVRFKWCVERVFGKIQKVESMLLVSVKVVVPLAEVPGKLIASILYRLALRNLRPSTMIALQICAKFQQEMINFVRDADSGQIFIRVFVNEN